MADIHKDRVVASNKALWTSQLYSDMTIRCGPKEYKVHRSVICPRSTFFAAACIGDFIVSICEEKDGSEADAYQEAKTATITMNDDDPQTVERMLLYLYMLDYADEDISDLPGEHEAIGRSLPPDSPCKSSTTAEEETTEEETHLVATFSPTEEAIPHDPRMMNNALVYAVAEKYDIPELKELAKRKFENLVISEWPPKDFHAVTEVIFSTTPDEDMGLRQIVIDICTEHFIDILKDEESRAAYLDTRPIAVAVLDAAMRSNDEDKVLLDEALAKQIALEDELSKVRADMGDALDQKNAWMSRLDSLLQDANNVTECRHCYEKFQWYIERLGHSSYLGMQLRCGVCRTKKSL